MAEPSEVGQGRPEADGTVWNALFGRGANPAGDPTAGALIARKGVMGVEIVLVESAADCSDSELTPIP